MSMAVPKPDRKYTYGDYLQRPDEERWEIIDGVPYDMSPAPSTKHQGILMEMAAQLHNYLRGKECMVFPAPFDVRLPRGNESDEEIDTVVQPDLSIICDISKLDERGCKGAPTVVIEIISPSTAKKELSEKFNLYERSGIPEYWVVFPGLNVVVIYSLDDEGKYQKTGEYSASQVLVSPLFPGMEIKLEEVFR